MTVISKPLPSEEDLQIIKVDPVYTVKKAAEMLDMKTGDIIYDLINSGQIEYVNLNPGGARKIIRIKASTINQIIKERTCRETA